MNNNEFSPVARAPRVSLFDGKALRFSTSTRKYNSSSCSSTGSSACSTNRTTSNNNKYKEKYKYLYNNDNKMRGYYSNRSSSSKNNYNEAEYLYRRSTSRSQSRETETDEADQEDTQIKHRISSHLHREVGQTRETGPTAKNVNQSILDMLLSIAESTNVKKTSQGTSIEKNDKNEEMSFSKDVCANSNNKPSITNIGLNTSHELSYGCSDDMDSNNNNKEKYSLLEEMCNISHSQDHDLVNREKLEQKESENLLTLQSSHKELVDLNVENKER